MSKRYSLEVYLADELSDTPAYAIESNTPFLPIQRGDFLDASGWNGMANQLADTALRVVAVEHKVCAQGDDACHTVGVMVERLTR